MNIKCTEFTWIHKWSQESHNTSVAFCSRRPIYPTQSHWLAWMTTCSDCTWIDWKGLQYFTFVLKEKNCISNIITSIFMGIEYKSIRSKNYTMSLLFYRKRAYYPNNHANVYLRWIHVNYFKWIVTLYYYFVGEEPYHQHKHIQAQHIGAQENGWHWRTKRQKRNCSSSEHPCRRKLFVKFWSDCFVIDVLCNCSHIGLFASMGQSSKMSTSVKPNENCCKILLLFQHG